jgi:hypothetical protein
MSKDQSQKLRPLGRGVVTDEPNACDLAILRLRAAEQAIADVDNPTSPVALSRELTGAPTDETLQAELRAASAEVEIACRGRGPSR